MGALSTVLIIQPDLGLSGAWFQALARGGHDVIAVRAVGDAVARVREGGIEAIVFDAPGDDADGAAVRELVGELDRLPDAPPLVLVSDSPRAPELSARVGAAAFLPKPCGPDDLVELVARVSSANVRGHRFDDETTAPRLKDF
jgi:DNA-binding NtrC family response regulator